MTCVLIISTLLITSQKAEFTFTFANTSCKHQISYISLKILSTSTPIHLTSAKFQTVQIPLNVLPSTVSHAILTTYTPTTSTSQLFPAVIFHSFSAENCVNFTDYKISPQEGIAAYFYEQNSCDVEIVEIRTIFTLPDSSKIVDSKRFDELLQGGFGGVSCGGNAYLGDQNAYLSAKKVAYHCCGQNFTCNQFQKTMMGLHQNVAEMSILMQISAAEGQKFAVNVEYQQVFINGLMKVKILRKTFIVDDSYFIAGFVFSEEIQWIENCYVCVTFSHVKLTLGYFPDLGYFALECTDFLTIIDYYQCLSNLSFVKRILEDNRDYHFSVTIFFQNEQKQLISRHSSLETINEISHTIIQKYWYRDGFLHFQLAESVGYDFDGIIMIEGMENQTVLFVGSQRLEYCFYSKKLLEMEEKRLIIDVIITIQEPEIVGKTMYLISFLIKPQFNYVWLVYVPVNVIGVVLGCFFLGQSDSEKYLSTY